MNTNDHLPAGERFIDAALSEHARLGRDGFDTELVHRILLETVNRPPSSRPNAKQVTDFRMWMIGSAAAAALVAVVLVVLSSLPSVRHDRPTDELQFIVRHPAQPISPNKSAKATPPVLAADRYASPLNLVSPASPGSPATSLSAFGDGNFELITEMSPAFDKMPPSGNRQENWRITADHTSDSAGRRIYEGNVIVEHYLFRIEASEVSVSTSGSTRNSEAFPLVASHVKVTQEFPPRLATAKSLRFDPVSGSLILGGVESLETGEGNLNQFPDGSELVLSDGGFTVETPKVMKYASPEMVVPQGK